MAWALSGAPAEAERGAAQDAVAPAPEALSVVLARVTKHAERLEQMERRGSFMLQGRMEELDGKGRVDGTKEIVLRVTAQPTEKITEILSYLENGADKTSEAREKLRREQKEPDDPKKKFMLPFSPGAQHRYRFEVAERSGPTRVRVRYVPLERAENTYTGSAWIDQESGEILTMILAPTKLPVFVDRVEVTVVFENRTTLGRAPSQLTFDARGSLLFFKKHYRGSATLTEAKLAF